MESRQSANGLTADAVMSVVIEAVRIMNAAHNPDKQLRQLRQAMGDATKTLSLDPAEIRQVFDKANEEKKEKEVGKMNSYKISIHHFDRFEYQTFTDYEEYSSLVKKLRSIFPEFQYTNNSGLLRVCHIELEFGDCVSFVDPLWAEFPHSMREKELFQIHGIWDKKVYPNTYRIVDIERRHSLIVYESHRNIYEGEIYNSNDILWVRQGYNDEITEISALK